MDFHQAAPSLTYDFDSTEGYIISESSKIHSSAHANTRSQKYGRYRGEGLHAKESVDSVPFQREKN